MTWRVKEILATGLFLAFVLWIGYRHGEHTMLIFLGLGTIVGLMNLLLELRGEIRSIKALLRENEPKGT